MVNKHKCWLCDQSYTELLDLVAHIKEQHDNVHNVR